MSMQDYAMTGYGIILNNRSLDEDALEEMADDGVIDVQFAFTGEAFPLDDAGVERWGAGSSFDDETLYFVALPRHPEFFRAAYRDMDALVDDMARAYGRVKGLPPMTRAQIRENIRSIQGTYYG